MLELLREKNYSEFFELTKDLGFTEILGKTYEFNSYRTYFKIDKMGKILKKDSNLALIKLTFLGKKYLQEYFEKGLYITERRKIDKIDRMSQFDVELLEKNLYKVFYNRDLSIAYRYCKEFILKDKEFFIKKLSHYILLDRIDNEKSLLTLAFIEALKEVNKDNIDFLLFTYLPYLINCPTVIDNIKSDKIEVVEKNQMNLNGIAYLKLISFGYEEYQNDYFSKLSKYAETVTVQESNDELFERLSENIDELYKVWNRVRASSL